MSCQKKSKTIKSKIQVKKTKSKIQVKKVKTRKHRGGSYASDLVMAAANGPVVRNDFVSDPRVRDGPNADYIGLGGSTSNQTGGSAASDMTMENLKDLAKTNKYVEGWKVQGDMNSLNTYQPSGGTRKSKSHKNNKRNHKSKNHKSNKSNSNSKSKTKRANKSKNNKRRKNNHNHNHNHVIKGGSSDYMASYYSLNGNVARPNIAWDPATRDLAGSGAPMVALEGANVSRSGSPIV